MRFAQISSSRDYWKMEAVLRRKSNESLARQNKVLKEKLRRERQASRAARARAEELEKASTPNVMPRGDVRVVCVMMFYVGIISCRSVKRVLALLAQSGRIRCGWIPHSSSIVNWVGRAGLGLLNAVAKIPTRWMAIVDTSISFGRTKALVVLRVPLDHFTRANAAPTVVDVECIGLVVSETWNGDTVHSALKTIFEKSGFPSAILKDGGGDLAKGARLLQETHPELIVLEDVGHVAANELKRLYGRNEVLGRFLALVNAARCLMSQSQIASLRPPIIRSKGRFQSISRVTEWAANALLLMGGRGQAPAKSLACALRRCIPGLAKMRAFIERFERDCRTINRFLLLLKNNGLNEASYAAAQPILDLLPKTNRLRPKLTAWLLAHKNLRSQLNMGDAPLLVSSDIIETVMGMLKNVIERMPIPEFTTLALATPLFCGAQTEASIQDALRRCAHGDLIDWRSENCSNTHRKVKRDLLIGQVVEHVPKPPINLSP